MHGCKIDLMDGNFSTTSRIRAIRLREDLKQIADLIELCFSENIDSEGREYIKHIRQTANNYSGFLLENTTPENSSLPFHGYVCVENDAIIGNLTLIPLRNREKYTYFVANVAVHPDYRGRGIGRKLTERAIRHVGEHNGKRIYLQVKDDNVGAIRLYQKLGFEEICRRTMWVYRPKDSSTLIQNTSIKVMPRTKEDWQQQKYWLEDLYPKKIRWNLPIRIDRLEPTFSNWFSRLLNGDLQRSWSVRKDSTLIGTASMERGIELHDYIWLASSPIWEDEVIQTALPVIQQKAFFPRRLAINYPAGRGRISFDLVNMHEVNTLLWMEYKIIPINESILV